MVLKGEMVTFFLFAEILSKKASKILKIVRYINFDFVKKRGGRHNGKVKTTDLRE